MPILYRACFGSKVFVFTAEFTEAAPLFIPGHPYECLSARLSYCNSLIAGVCHNSAGSRGSLTDLTAWVILLPPCFPWFLPAFVSHSLFCLRSPRCLCMMQTVVWNHGALGKYSFVKLQTDKVMCESRCLFKGFHILKVREGLQGLRFCFCFTNTGRVL